MTAADTARLLAIGQAVEACSIRPYGVVAEVVLPDGTTTYTAAYLLTRLLAAADEIERLLLLTSVGDVERAVIDAAIAWREAETSDEHVSSFARLIAAVDALPVVADDEPTLPGPFTAYMPEHYFTVLNSVSHRVPLYTTTRPSGIDIEVRVMPVRRLEVGRAVAVDVLVASVPTPPDNDEPEIIGTQNRGVVDYWRRRATLSEGQYVVEVRRPAQGEQFLDPSSFRDPPIHTQTITTPYERRVVIVRRAVATVPTPPDDNK